VLRAPPITRQYVVYIDDYCLYRRDDETFSIRLSAFHMCETVLAISIKLAAGVYSKLRRTNFISTHIGLT